MLEYINKFERGVYYVLMVLLAGSSSLASLNSSLSFFALFSDLSYRLGNHEILQIFGYFLLILIRIEPRDDKAYLLKNEIQVEIIVLVAIIAVARKIILLDPFIEGLEELNANVMIALGVVIIALSASYYLIRRTSPR
ncbi:MAG: phosphate-starvation-inducible PsiE family protein [Methanolinea sp.]|nr:MAG: phosphate-starvation-inducible PsiE family protein [Methanolinea sp.]